MTWLKGQTTWSVLTDKLVQLACGEVADDSSVTVAVGDRWVRDIVGQNVIRPPAAQDVALPQMGMRAGYWTLVNPTPTVNAPTTAARSVLRQTGLASASPSGATRWHAQIQVSTPNSVAGNYSTLRFSYSLFNSDTGSLIYSNSGFAPDAAGNITSLNFLNASLVISDPSGIVPAGTMWYRSFDNDYRGGFDFWPMWSRRVGVHTFGTAPTGVEGTDWAVTAIPAISATELSNTTYGGARHGLGIKTVTGLSGNLYTVSWSVAGIKARLFNNVTSAGQIDLWIGNGSALDGATWRHMGSYAVTAWLRPYQTPASVTAGSAVQYWMSVKATKIVVILNADPGQTGKLTCAWFGKYTPYYPAWDILPWVTSWTAQDYTADTAPWVNLYNQFSLFGQKSRLDGTSEAARDWQTGWMRCDYPSASDWGLGGFSNPVFPGFVVDYEAATTWNIGLVSAQSNKPSSLDGKWWLYGPVFYDFGYTTGTSNNASSPSVIPNDYRGVPRGRIEDGVLFIPGGGWASGDELTDTVTGKKYFLVAADYHGLLARIRQDANNFAGGAAVLEE